MKRASLFSIFFLLLVACGTTPTVTMPTANPTASTVELTKTPTSTPTEIPTPTETPLKPLFTVKVLSYNILYGAGVDRQFDENLKASGQYNQFGNRNRLPEFLSFVQRMNPDILGIQEANGWDRGTPPVIQQVAQELGMNYFLAKTAGGFHIALLTKFNILETENLSSEVGRQGALRATLSSPDGEPLNVFVVHLDPFSSDTRLCQVNTLIQQMQPYFHQRTILMGDMNFGSSSREYAKLEQAGLKSVAVESRLRIDQIWITPAVNWAKTAWFQSFGLPVGVSDHHPIGAGINILPTLTTVSTITPMPPTPTIVAPSYVSDILTNVRVLRIDRFNDPCTQIKWNSRWVTEKLTNGILEVGGEENWKASVSRLKDFTEGQGIVIRFQFAKGTESNVFIDSGIWNTDSYRRFGISIVGDTVQTSVYQGKTRMSGKNLEGNFKPEPDAWLNLVIAINKNGELMETLWDASNPPRTLRYRERLGEKWTGLTWRFTIQANKGKMLINDFAEISFSEIK